MKLIKFDLPQASANFVLFFYGYRYKGCQLLPTTHWLVIWL